MRSFNRASRAEVSPRSNFQSAETKVDMEVLGMMFMDDETRRSHVR